MQVDFSISINFECLSSLHRKYFSIKFLYTFVIIKFFFGRSRNILYSKRIIFVSIISFFHQGIFHTFISLIILINEYSYSVTHFLRSFSLSFYLHVRFLENPQRTRSNRESSPTISIILLQSTIAIYDVKNYLRIDLVPMNDNNRVRILFLSLLFSANY